MRRQPSARRWLSIAVIAAVAVLAFYPQQRQYFHDRYRTDVAPPLDNPGFRATDQWRLIQTWAREQHGMRIGVVGTPAAYGQYVFYGDDLSNEVRYLGEPRPYGGLVPIESCRRWRELVDRGRFDAIVITPEDPGSPLMPEQIAWTLDPAAMPVLRVLPAAVFMLSGPLPIDGCARREGVDALSPRELLNPHLAPPGWLWGTPGSPEALSPSPTPGGGQNPQW